MTHEEAAAVLPDFALGAFDGDAAALERHLDTCAVCSAQWSLYLATTTRLAEAVPVLDPPERLRAAVLADGAVLRADRRYRQHRRRPITGFLLPAAAVLILTIGLAGRTLQQQQRLEAAQAELRVDGQGLALLTSTETTVQRLEPVIGPLLGPGTPAHGHWYHRQGIQTQVLVAEFLPAPPPGEAYFGWLQRADGSLEARGRFALDSQGYGRLILLGHEGTDVTTALVTLQATSSVAAPGQVVLRWPAG
jgi:hypothetical protein